MKNSIKTEKISCPLCDRSSGVPWAEENGFTAEKCSKCGFVYVNPRPVASMISEAVKTGVHSSIGDGHSVINRRLEKKVSMYRKLLGEMFADVWRQPDPVSWLDIGAGYGEVVEAIESLAPKGSRVIGIEPMEPKAADARGRGLKIKHCYLTDVDEKFDFVSLVNVFSHIPDFRDFLATLSGILRSGGELFLETGNVGDLDSSGEMPSELDLPDHLVFAGEQNIRDFLEEAGFEVLEITRHRRDGFIAVGKNIVKKILGRKVPVTLPYTSPYRTLLFRARLG